MPGDRRVVQTSLDGEPAWLIRPNPGGDPALVEILVRRQSGRMTRRRVKISRLTECRVITAGAVLALDQRLYDLHPDAVAAFLNRSARGEDNMTAPRFRLWIWKPQHPGPWTYEVHDLLAQAPEDKILVAEERQVWRDARDDGLTALNRAEQNAAWGIGAR
jgi:hypothetical protein